MEKRVGCIKGQIRQNNKCVAPYPEKGYIYQIKYKKGYPFKIDLIGGSTVKIPSGTHSILLKNKDKIKFLSGAPDGTTWWEYRGERMKHEGNGWTPMLKENLKIIKK